jgi:hypothetical protein
MCLFNEASRPLIFMFLHLDFGLTKGSFCSFYTRHIANFPSFLNNREFQMFIFKNMFAEKQKTSVN